MTLPIDNKVIIFLYRRSRTFFTANGGLFVVVYSRIKENTLQVTPSAKRNSYRVAILVGRLPRVASFARNPGLGKRNSYRVARLVGCLPRVADYARNPGLGKRNSVRVAAA